MLKVVAGGGSGRIATKVDIVTDIELFAAGLSTLWFLCN